ncbi:MAG: UvrD-helicase domain-containing protein [Parasporobacterium sp.]|nr:UvrD-helicase domain-containing protein [Parasporobacterium sp.]
MKPKYSILLCNQVLAEYSNQIEQWLKTGIKVIWFGKLSDVTQLKEQFSSYLDAFLLLAYEYENDVSGIVIDGCDDRNLLSTLEKQCLSFNAAQYQVEHCSADNHIVVQASAGTGKTKVMVDRIMYLMHTVPDLDMSEIFMITFTNDAADQMNKRLQDTLITRYHLTKQIKYLKWLEQQSQMNISTIHSFALKMLKEYGIGDSFTQDLKIRSFIYEKKELIKDVIDSKTSDGKSVSSQLGVPFYRANELVKEFWDGITRLGISHGDLEKMDWGQPLNEESAPFHQIMTDIIKRLDDQYFDIKRQNDAVSVDDIMRDLQEVLMSEDLPMPDLNMKYLFIDEFQDTDLSQIMVACILVKLLHTTLFVVGDVKQSIYGFRGATDQAFFVLERDMREMNIPEAKTFALVNNYRTAAGVLNNLGGYFQAWGNIGRLQYNKPVIPFNRKEGHFEIIPGEKKDFADQQIADVVNAELNKLVEKINSSGRKPSEKNRVVVLTRTNKELTKVSGILRAAKIPASVRREGFFYASEAVRDFYMMVSSFLFSDEPKYIFNYLLTPYAGSVETMDIHQMELLSGDYENLVDYLDNFLSQTSWKHYHKELRLRPVMAVFKDMIDNGFVIDYFIANSKTRKRANGWEEARCNAATRTEAVQYQANLEKLMELLQRNLGGEKVSLYDIYKFLKLNISTNRSEEEPVVQTTDDYTSVLCMTVHKSKGLEFDTIILPYTNRAVSTWEKTEIIIDPVARKIGWNYTGDTDQRTKRYKYPKMTNTLYSELKDAEIESSLKEECRILYVAMTRAIDSLVCIVSKSKNDRTWAYLLEEGGALNA